MVEVKSIQQEAEFELREEQSKIAKGKIKDHLRKIGAAKAVLANLEREYEVILREIGSDGV